MVRLETNVNECFQMQLLGVVQVLIALGSLSCSSSAARILAILPLAARSHHNFHQGVLKALASRGHEVVVFGPFPQATPIPNYTDVYVSSRYNDDYRKCLTELWSGPRLAPLLPALGH